MGIDTYTEFERWYLRNEYLKQPAVTNKDLDNLCNSIKMLLLDKEKEFLVDVIIKEIIAKQTPEEMLEYSDELFYDESNNI